MSVTRRPLVPPSPPPAANDMTAIGRMAPMRVSPIGTWGQRAYEEDIIQGRFFGRSSFILNTPDAIRHVLVDNYEDYTGTPAGAAGKHHRGTLAPAFTPRAVASLVPHMITVTDETIAKLEGVSGGPV